MGIFFVYILKSSVCLAVFYLFYRLLLSRETFHRFNRVALLGILFLSCFLPLVEVTVEKQTEVHQTMMNLEQWLMLVDGVSPVSTSGGQEEGMTVTWIQVALLVYWAGILFFAIRSVCSLVKLLAMLRMGRKEDLGEYIDDKEKVTLIVHERDIAPFSWMKYIVISRKDLDENGWEILIHELAHIHNRHSWDLLVADICIFFQWFNPASWLLKQELQNIHEYEADETVIETGVDAKQYQLLLIKKAVGTRLYSMANSFNHSKLKKRITMMLKEKSSPWARLKYLYVLPVAAVAVTAFARPDISETTEEIAAVKVNDLTAIVKTKVTKTAEDVQPLEVIPMDTAVLKDTVKPTVLVHSSLETTEKLKGTPVAEEGTLPVIFKLEGEKTVNSLAIKEEASSDLSAKDENLPLVVVDGKEVTSSIMSALDPNKIEKMTVLKNEDAINLYGDKGKNGVVLIDLKGSKQSVTLSSKSPVVSVPGVNAVQLANRRADWTDVEVYVDGVQIDLDGKALDEVVSPGKIKSFRVEKGAEGTDKGKIYKGKIYITTKEDRPAIAEDEIWVEGIVQDKEGEPVIGATVLIEGTNRGTVTDRDGRFVMPAAKKAMLVVSYVNMKTAKVKVASKLTVTLQDE